MHRNPVKRGLAEKPEDWDWSSFRAYAFQQVAPVRVNYQEWPLTISYSLLGPSHSKPANEWGTRPVRLIHTSFPDAVLFRHLNFLGLHFNELFDCRLKLSMIA